MDRLIEILHHCQETIDYALAADWSKDKLRELLGEIRAELAAAEEEAWDHSLILDKGD